MAVNNNQYTLIFDTEKQEEFDKTIFPALKDWDVEPLAFEQCATLDLPSDARVLTWLGDAQLLECLDHARQQGWQLGILPHPGMVRFYRSFPIKNKLPDVLEEIQSIETPNLADLMTCNGELVVGAVMLGKRETMAPASQIDAGFFQKVMNLFKLTMSLRQSHLHPFRFETAKNAVVNTAALGIAVVYRPTDSQFTRAVVGETEQDESTLNAVILAPRSISEVVRFLFSRIFPRHLESNHLTDYLGVIKSEKITITANSQNVGYFLNGEIRNAEKLEIQVEVDALKLLTSSLPEKSNQKDLKESLKVSCLPIGQGVEELVSYPLPWIHHSDPEEVKETFITLKENAKVSESFLVLMVLSTLLATVGLFANSAPVIIGAMILAPLMAPIISLAMGALRQDRDLIFSSGKTLVIGILLGLSFGTLLTLLLPLHSMNSEISARTSPTLLDLAVAIVSGIAGAYANTRSEVAKSMAGVAIAVALVPPLAVSGIGIGWFDFSVFYGAFLLFVTNLIGIVLAAALTFLLMGFSPFRRAKKGMTLALVFVVLVSIPLGFSFHKMVTEQRMVNAIEGWKVNDVVISGVKVRNEPRGEPDFVSATLVSNQNLTEQQIDRVKHSIEKKLGHPILLEAKLAIQR